MAGLASTAYNIFFKRTSTFVVTILVGSFVFERGFDLLSDSLYESINKGKLWKDIKHKYGE